MGRHSSAGLTVAGACGSPMKILRATWAMSPPVCPKWKHMSMVMPKRSSPCDVWQNQAASALHPKGC